MFFLQGIGEAYCDHREILHRPNLPWYKKIEKAEIRKELHQRQTMGDLALFPLSLQRAAEIQRWQLQNGLK